MIIINKKRISIIILVILMGIYTFSHKTEEKNIEVTATPVSNKTVILDAGHGSPDEGAESKNRNNRSKNKFTNSIKTTKTIRKQWM